MFAKTLTQAVLFWVGITDITMVHGNAGWKMTSVGEAEDAKSIINRIATHAPELKKLKQPLSD